jgi:hypothetical protein
MNNLLGVSAQTSYGLLEIISRAAVLSAISFLFFCHPERSRRAFFKKQKRMPLPSLTQRKIYD